MELLNLEVLYDKHSQPILSMVRSILANEDDADDVMHDAFLKAFSRISQAKDFGPWIKGIARNLAFDRLRRSRRGIEILQGDIPEPPCSRPGPALHAEMAEFGMAASRAMDRLSSEQRAVLDMRLDGASHKEISKALGVPVGTSLSRTNFIKHKLRCLMAEFDPEA